MTGGRTLPIWKNEEAISIAKDICKMLSEVGRLMGNVGSQFQLRQI
jgi:hypothetical protein